MKIFKNFIFYTFLIFMLFTFTACFKSGYQQNSDSVLIVGTNTEFPPYEMINQSGEIIGFDIDTAKIIAQKLNKKLIVKDMAFDALIIALKQNKIDLIISGMSITQSRKNEIEMIHYHGKLLKSLPLLFWNKIPENVKTVYDLKNQTVCVQPGTIQDEIISKFKNIQVKYLDTIPDLIMDIKFGGSIAALIEPAVALSLQEKNPDIKTLNLILGQEQQTFGHGIGINKENHNLITKVETIITQLKTDKTLEKLETKWFKNNIKD